MHVGIMIILYSYGGLGTDQLKCRAVFCMYDPIILVVRFWSLCGPSLRQDEFSGNPDDILQ